jgi:hypothetical protein
MLQRNIFVNKEEYHTKISFVRQKYQKGINDLYIWTMLVIDLMQKILKDTDYFKTKIFDVPTKQKVKQLERNPEQLKTIIENAGNSDIVKANFVYLVAQYESFFQEIYYYVLCFKTTLSEESRQEKVLKFTFLPPYKQFEYFEQYILSDTIEQILINQLIELKASRDLIVHNDGNINKKYMDKAGLLARGELGDAINITNEYFGNSLSTIKSIIGQITSQLQRQLK